MNFFDKKHTLCRNRVFQLQVVVKPATGVSEHVKVKKVCLATWTSFTLEFVNVASLYRYIIAFQRDINEGADQTAARLA